MDGSENSYMIQEKSGINEILHDVSNLKNGIYMLKISNYNISKFIINH
jgi:hypothetical protein